jgi:ribosomal protein S18 acetylase RimI-like enzyme
LEEAEKAVRQKGATQMWLWVLETNDRAIAFYKKHQYETIGNATFQMEINRYENKVMLKSF